MTELAGYCEKCCASNSGGIGGGAVAALVKGTLPAMSAMAVPLDTKINFLLTVMPDLGSVNQGTVSVTPPFAWTAALGQSPEELEITPNAPLQPNTEYTVLIHGVASIEAEPVLPYMLKFRTV
ncbi:MAG: Ig-like domain-containing protein [Candidatus Brocadiia bacterium]